MPSRRPSPRPRDEPAAPSTGAVPPPRPHHDHGDDHRHDHREAGELRPSHDHDHDPRDVEAALDRLRGGGFRLTAERRAIVDALYTGPSHHLTAELLHDAARGHAPELHLATVYRTLEALEAAGVVTRLAADDGVATYHLADDDHDHHHLVCDACGAVVEVPRSTTDELAATVAHRYGFALADRHLSLAGRCAACR